MKSLLVNNGSYFALGDSYAPIGPINQVQSYDLEEWIIIDPEVLSGKYVIKGTRLAVEFISKLLAKDWPESETLRNYLGLTHEDIQA